MSQSKRYSKINWFIYWGAWVHLVTFDDVYLNPYNQATVQTSQIIVDVYRSGSIYVVNWPRTTVTLGYYWQNSGSTLYIEMKWISARRNVIYIFRDMETGLPLSLLIGQIRSMVLTKTYVFLRSDPQRFFREMRKCQDLGCSESVLRKN